MNIKRYVTLLPLGVLFIFFTALDLFTPHMVELSGAVKFASICLCWMWAVMLWAEGASPLLPTAMTATVTADTGLLFGLHPTPFIAVFALAQILHGLRVSRVKPVIAAVLCAAIAGSVVGILVHDTLMGIATAYTILLLFNTSTAIKQSKRPGGALAAVGFILFVCCDVCVALNNITIPPRWVQVMMWVFYLPSQALIIASAERSTRQ